MDRHALRARLAAPSAVEAMALSDAEAIAVRASSDDGHDLADGKLRPAAVLVPLVHGAQPGVILTRRAAHLTDHPGQVAFPGGRIEPHDASPEAAALREAHEEIGVQPHHVELLGRLPVYVTGTGWRVWPVLGLLQPGLVLRPAPGEVEAIFTLPLDTLLDPAAPERRRAEFRGRMREFWVWPHCDYYIWGATAAILVHLAHKLRAHDMAA